MHLAEPRFPPLLTGHAARAPDEPFALARREAAAGHLAAGDLVWARNVDTMDCAVILEPDVSRARSTEMLLAAMVAVGDAIGALAPPEVGVHYRWPQTILVNGATVGIARLAMAPASDEAGCPLWLCVGVAVRIRAKRAISEPGSDIERTTLFDEGCADIDRTALLESFSRHLLLWIDRWETDGFGPIHDMWLGRMAGGAGNLTVETRDGPVAGTFVGLDESGNLLVRTEHGIAAVRALDALAPEPFLAANTP